MDQDIKVKTLFKALQILECFTEEKPELGITDISNRLGLYKSNVFNILSTFEKTGYVERNPENNKYRLGIKVLELAYIVNTSMDFRKQVLPLLHEIAQQTGEVVYLGIPHENEVVYLEMILPKNSMAPRPVMGEKAPIYSTAIGKSMMAHFSDEQVSQIIRSGLKKITENTITKKEQLLQELAMIRTRGYAVDNMENEYGIKCIGKALINRKGQVVAGISVSGPSLRFSDERIGLLYQILEKHISQMKDRI